MAVYCVDDAGMPTDPDVVQALADATCAQVEYQQATGPTRPGPRASQSGLLAAGRVQAKAVPQLHERNPYPAR